jgi:hypothetical protein
MVALCELSKDGLSFYADAAGPVKAHLHYDNSSNTVSLASADGFPVFISAKIAPVPDGTIPYEDDAVNAGWVQANFRTEVQVDTAIESAVSNVTNDLTALTATVGDNKTAADTNDSARASEIAQLDTRATALESQVEVLEGQVEGLSRTTVSSGGTTVTTFDFGDAKLKATALEVTNVTTVNQTVTNTTITDKCVVYNYGATGDLDASLLFAKSNNKDRTNKYAGICRKAGTPAGADAVANPAIPGKFVFVDHATGTKDDAETDHTNVDGIDDNGATYAICVAEKFQSQSDQRLKENVVPIDGALGKVGAMRGVYYDWIDKAKGSARQIGVIAQEVQAACPELVDASDTYLTVDYARIAAVLIEAVKDLTARNAALDARVAALEKAA